MDGSQFGLGIDERSWQDIAPVAGAVARFIWYLDAGECEIDEVLRRLTGLETMVGRQPVESFVSHIAPEDWPHVQLAVSDAVEGNQVYSTEFRFVRPDGSIIWLAGSGRVTTTINGDRVVVGVNYDVTDKYTQLERANLVAHEMNHRVKNILAVVAGIFRATARSSDDRDALSEAFMHRLDALTALNDVVIRGGSQSALLPDLVDAVLRPVRPSDMTADIQSISVNGPAAQTIALVLGELMTNAVKYGALAPEGQGVVLSIKDQGGIVRLKWTETAGRPVQAPSKSTGFGMKVLTNMTAATFDGRPSLTWRPEGLEFICDWPSDQLRPMAQPHG